GDGWNVALATLFAHHVAALDAQLGRRAGARADPRGSDLRRSVRADRRWPGFRDDVHRAVHLPDRLCGIDSSIRARSGRVTRSCGVALGAYARSTPPHAQESRRAGGTRRWLT